jgi:hypothetical protein
MQQETVETLGGFWTLRGAAPVVGKSYRTLQLWARFKRFEYITVGGTILTRLDDLRVIPGVAERLDAMKAEMTD